MPLSVHDLARQHRMFQRHEHADAAGGWIYRASKGDDQEERIVVDHSECDARGDREAGGGEQELAVIVDVRRRKSRPRQVEEVQPFARQRVGIAPTRNGEVDVFDRLRRGMSTR